jgi:hypothetical protein
MVRLVALLVAAHRNAPPSPFLSHVETGATWRFSLRRWPGAHERYTVLAT